METRLCLEKDRPRQHNAPEQLKQPILDKLWADDLAEPPKTPLVLAIDNEVEKLNDLLIEASKQRYSIRIGEGMIEFFPDLKSPALMVYARREVPHEPGQIALSLGGRRADVSAF